jgi:hypothetical protein
MMLSMRNNALHRFSKKLSKRLIHTVVRSIAFNDNSFREFWAKAIEAQQPVVLRGFASHWPAVGDEARRWSDLPNLQHRLSATEESDSMVRIELGKNYMDTSVTEGFASLSSVLEHINSSNSKSSTDSAAMPPFYVAQFSLDQVAVLRDDVPRCPSFPSSGKSGGDEAAPLIDERRIYGRNLWLNGTKGSES